MDDADGIGRRIVRTEGVGADEFGETIGLVGVGAAYATHFVENDRNAGLRRLPGGFRSGEPAADDMDGGNCTFHHGLLLIMGHTKGQSFPDRCERRR